jgi:Class III cytochrome C family/Ferric reductase like transmembrane component
VRNFDARFALWGAALCLLATLPAFAGFAGVGWELSQVVGLLGCIGCLLLSGAPLRPRQAQPPTLLTLQLHTLIGWLALLAVAIHVAGLVLSDRLVVEYLKPTAPVYQLAGVAASVVLLVVVLSGLTGVRRRLWSSHRGFQSTHVILGCVLIVLIAVHVVVTARYVGGRGRRVLILAAMIGGLLMLMRPRRIGAGLTRAGTSARQRVFGRNSTLVFAVVTILAMSLAGLMGAAAGAALREPLLHRTAGVPLDFPHSKHVAVNCIACHHNFADGRGLDGCIACHQSSRTDLKEGVEARFHSFCFSCHRHPDASLTKHGPVSGCKSCHNPGSTP